VALLRYRYVYVNVNVKSPQFTKRCSAARKTKRRSSTTAIGLHRALTTQSVSLSLPPSKMLLFCLCGQRQYRGEAEAVTIARSQYRVSEDIADQHGTQADIRLSAMSLLDGWRQEEHGRPAIQHSAHHVSHRTASAERSVLLSMHFFRLYRVQ